MKHKCANRSLGRVTAAREQLFKNLIGSLLAHGSIVTTRARAKELRRFFEPLVSEARGEMTLARRRRLLRRIKKSDLAELFRVAEAQKTRPGGYLRLTRLPRVRSDGSEMTKVDILYG